MGKQPITRHAQFGRLVTKVVQMPADDLRQVSFGDFPLAANTRRLDGRIADLTHTSGWQFLGIQRC